MVQQNITPQQQKRRSPLFILVVLIFSFLSGCAQKPLTRTLTATAYCGCSKCCSWGRGNPHYLYLDFWNRYVRSGPDKGREYSGLTASNTKPREPQEGFFSIDSIKKPWMIPLRLVLFPWLFASEKGTIAADTKYYPFGTEMFVPGYGWGIVEDRGGAIKGPNRIDLYFDSHSNALAWGRQRVEVEIYWP